MSFNEASTKLAGMFTERGDAMLEGRSVEWCLSEYGDIAEFIKTFDSADENDEWKTLTAEYEGDLNNVVGARARIAWLCGARADLRKQFAAGTDDHARNHIDMRRFSYMQQRQRKHGLAHANDLMEIERKKPITE